MQKRIKKITAVFFYIIVIYYLLPFSPVALYYSAHHPAAGIKTQQVVIASGKMLVNQGVSFPIKDKNRFDVDSLFLITPSLNEFIISYKTISFPVLNVNYSDSFSFRRSGRGPPSSSFS